MNPGVYPIKLLGPGSVFLEMRLFKYVYILTDQAKKHFHSNHFQND